ncbi:hypothetical protein CAEBREN_07548 [Caenorhabditis brenneri]|uniref:DUF38 domain-containing protein n=1 Tax=Caenorhabditis brenneri TaxID=135651 RepID=G0N1G7_CAEBE|nr:hypothetical protein CAEBREN_07548 [Caenorhabditis brenneri]
MESIDLNLIQMPEVIMGHILDKLDIPDIMNFDKGDDLYPEGKLLRIKYGFVECAPDLCTVQWFRSDGNRETCFEDCDVITRFCRDFEFIFGGHSIFKFFRKPKNPSIIQDFTLNLEYCPDDHVHWDATTRRLLSSMESTLQNRSRLLPVKEFYTVVFDKFHVLQMLPCFQPKTLEKISITYTVERGCWFLRGLMELEQWKMAKVLFVFDTVLSGDIRKFKHFEEINIKRGKVEVKDILLMKKAILNSGTNLTTGRVGFRACDGEPHFLQTYGDPFTDTDELGDERNSWFFKIPNKKSFLQISFYPQHLKFAVLEKAPEDARVIRE